MIDLILQPDYFEKHNKLSYVRSQINIAMHVIQGDLHCSMALYLWGLGHS